MLATAIIVFREVLEAALIVGIVHGGEPRHRASRRLGRAAASRPGWSARLLVAAGAETIAAAAAGHGPGAVQRRDPARRGRDARLAQYLDDAAWPRDGGRRQPPRGRRCATGARPLWALALAVGLAVLREGSEVVLFLYGIAATDGGAGGDGAGRRARASWAAWRPGRRFISGWSASRCAICSRSPAGWSCCLPPAWHRKPPPFWCRPICCRRSATSCGTPRFC